MKNLVQLILIGGGSLLLTSAMIMQKPAAWVAPKEADALKNPVKDDAAATKAGKDLYVTNCTPCHGSHGKGDGPAAAALSPKPSDHTSAKVQVQTDGAIYWKITNGHPPMAAYKGSLSDKQRWELVNYIRVLGQTQAKKK